MKLRSANKNFVFNLSPGTVFEILKFINPLLQYFISRHFFHDVINIDYDKRLPISLLLSLHNLEVLENFKAVLLNHPIQHRQYCTIVFKTKMIVFNDSLKTYTDEQDSGRSVVWKQLLKFLNFV